MEITTYSSSGNPVGTKHRLDRSKPGQRCITYHDYDVSEIKKSSKQEKISKHNKIHQE